MASLETVGKRLRDLRGMKQREEVARALGVSTSALAMYETGKRMPRDEIKAKIAAYYNASIEEIFFAA